MHENPDPIEGDRPMNPRRNMSRRDMLQLSGAAAVLALSGCSRKSSSDRLLHVATTAGVNLTMWELLRQQKFLEEFNVQSDVVAMADGSKILGGIYSGSIDIAPMSGFSQIFPAIERGADIKIINAAALVPMLALYSGKDNVHSLEDLEGKVVGVGSLGALDHQLTVTLLRKYSVDVGTVRFVNIGSNTDVFKGVIAGTVDGGVGPASYFNDAASYNVHAIQNGNMSTELQEFTYQAGWTSNRIIEAKRDSLVRVLAAYAKLFRFVLQPSSMDAFIKARKTVFPHAPEREHMNEWNFLQTAKPFATELLLSPERVRYMQQTNLDFHVQKQMLPFERVADMSLARDALKLLG
jgi:ABC-type nitrate/sulfonate/bicarbonate transport system substrate-binding protein